jgi:hypothetical protein
MTTVEANGVALGAELLGEATAPLVLLVSGATILSWPDALCAALARLGRCAVRYDLRDCGASTTVDPEAPTYTLRDLAADAAALARDLDDQRAHAAGIGVGVGGWSPRSLGSITPKRSRRSPWSKRDPSLRARSTTICLTMMPRRWPGCSRAPCPTGLTAPMSRVAVVGAEILGDDPTLARAGAERQWDRTAGTQSALHLANQPTQ